MIDTAVTILLWWLFAGSLVWLALWAQGNVQEAWGISKIGTIIASILVIAGGPIAGLLNAHAWLTRETP